MREALMGACRAVSSFAVVMALGWDGAEGDPVEALGQPKSGQKPHLGYSCSCRWISWWKTFPRYCCFLLLLRGDLEQFSAFNQKNSFWHPKQSSWTFLNS